MLFVEWASNLWKEVKKLGGDEQSIYGYFADRAKVAETAKLIVTNVAKKLALKSLKLIQDGIAIATESFSKDSFFKNGPVKLWFGDNFRSWILSAIPETVPAFEGKLVKTQLAEYMYDSAILNELGQPKPFTVGEFAAIVRNLLIKQPNGENGLLLTNGYANIFYIQLEGRVGVASVGWFSGGRGWRCGAGDLGDGDWRGGDCVLSRS